MTSREAEKKVNVLLKRLKLRPNNNGIIGINIHSLENLEAWEKFIKRALVDHQQRICFIPWFLGDYNIGRELKDRIKNKGFVVIERFLQEEEMLDLIDRTDLMLLSKDDNMAEFMRQVDRRVLVYDGGDFEDLHIKMTEMLDEI